MRQLVRGETVAECQKKVDRMKQRGWTQVSDIKLDDSQMAYGNFDYVCVMSMNDDGRHKGKNQWNRGRWT